MVTFGKNKLMRTGVLLLALICSVGASAQNAYWKFEIRSIEGGQNRLMENTKLYFGDGKYAMEMGTDGFYNGYVVDSVARTVLFRLTDQNEKTAYTDSLYINEDGYYSEKVDYVIGEDYILLDETKLIHGMECQKIQFTDAPEGVLSIGWVALNVHLHLFDNGPIWNLVEGTVVELLIRDQKGDVTLTLTEYDPNATIDPAVFSTAIPEGYRNAETIDN